ncbi:MAG: hypothetical protein M3076_14930 [Actinomycetota bacterium]|nr:hypothetical protein [Actinomycetota bacterium]
MRTIVFTLALAFTAALAALTVQDIADHGLTFPGVLALLIVLLLGFGIVGALIRAPRR